MKYFTDEYYHVYNRGVDKRKIFNRKEDYQHFLNGLTLLNSTQRVENTSYMMRKNYRDAISIESSLVEVVEYCLMPNHYHLLLRQLKDGGISEFTRKIGISHTHYFNIRHKRSGVLFQGRTKSKHVNSSEYLQYLVDYIHANPISLVEPKWKEEGVQDKERVVKFLAAYPWSSTEEFSWVDSL